MKVRLAKAKARVHLKFQNQVMTQKKKVTKMITRKSSINSYSSNKWVKFNKKKNLVRK